MYIITTTQRYESEFSTNIYSAVKSEAELYDQFENCREEVLGTMKQVLRENGESEEISEGWNEWHQSYRLQNEDVRYEYDIKIFEVNAGGSKVVFNIKKTKTKK